MKMPDVSKLGTVSIEGGTYAVFMVATDWNPSTDAHDSDHARGQCECPCDDPLSALENAVADGMAVPKVNGCICQTCAEREQECEFVALDGRDECPDCEAGRHDEHSEHPSEAGRQAMEWQGEPRLIR